MGSLHQREERTALSLTARLLAEEGWRDVIICNVSSRGMMLRCDAPPIRNTFIEVRHRNANVVGRVIWSRDGACGIYTQITIDAAEFASPSALTLRNQSFERRARQRTVEPHTISTRRLSTEDSSRIFARLFDYLSIVFTVVVGAMFLTGIVRDSMQEPLEKVGRALATPTSPAAN